MYITRQIKINKSEQLDFLAHEAGIVYTQTLVQFKRILRKKNIWLSEYAMKRLIRNDNLHSQTTQGIVETFYDNIKSWRELRKSNPRARLPKKHKWYFKILYKESAIRIKDGKLILSNGKGNSPIVIDWNYDKPKYVEISYNEGYVLNATYNIQNSKSITSGDTAGIDLGETHIAVANTENKTIIINGRELRSKNRYLNKTKASFQSSMDKCKKGSRRYKRLKWAKNKMRKRLNNQIKDILHKQTTKLVNALKEENVMTVAIGDVRNIRQNVDCGRYANQKIHQMSTGKTREYITYKSERVGMKIELVNEAYSTQTCIRCGKKHKPTNRNYECPKCKVVYHRDVGGAVNIRSKAMYRKYVSVVGDMTPPIGVRYYANSQ